MIYYIRGKLVYTEPGAAVVDTGAVAYKMFVSANTIAALSSKMNEDVKIYTCLSVREDAITLYGFNSLEEKSVFNMLISVSGVGPKAALAILSVMTPSQFALSVTSGDTKAISKADGVGPKIAARIVLELKDKLSKEIGSITSDKTTQLNVTHSGAQTGKYSDALNALVVLGYTRGESSDALQGLDFGKLSLEELITAALKKLMK